MKKYIPYLYLLRIPLSLGLALAAFPLLAIYSPLGTLLENLFDLTPRGTFLTTFVAVIASWSLLLTARLVLLNGEQRFGTHPTGYADNLSSKKVIGVIALALPAAFVQFTRNTEFAHHGAAIAVRLWAIAAGIFSAWLTAFFGLLVAVLFAPAGTQQSARTFPAPSILRGLLTTADQLDPLGAFWRRAAPRLRALPPFLSAGYLDPATGFPLSGHWQAFVFGGVTLVLFAAIDLAKQASLANDSLPIPALFFVLWIILNAIWVVAFLAFLFDRARIPLSIPFALAVLVSAQFQSNDHFFQVLPQVNVPAITPAAVLRNRLAHGRKIVLVACDGGGIQAAAWAARVLTGLQLDSLGNYGSPAWPQDFAGNVALVSAVSGGAAGSMFFLNQYRPAFTTPPAQLQQVVDDASAPSLDNIGWALVYHDLPRIYWPLFFTDPQLDRGLMLEQSWRRHGHIEATLGQWRQGVLEGLRPAVIFNSTIVETGRPMLLATTDIPDQPDSHKGDFHRDSAGLDIPVVTAARVASTFPYVSPAARPSTPYPQYHLVDGGYYDNYGLSSLVSWLFAVVKDRPDDVPEILIVRTVSFPTTLDPKPQSRSAVFELYAPLAAMFGVRVSSQAIRDNEDLDRLTNRWPQIQVARFQFHAPDAPLSWQMNASQHARIEDQWRDAVGGSSDNHVQLQLVRSFFGVIAAH